MPEVIPALTDRRARRSFDPRPIPGDVQETLWRSVSVAPSHGNAQPVRLLVAESSGVREALIAGLSDGNRGWAAASPLLVVIAAMPAHDAAMEGSDGSRRELWAFHAGIAAGNLMAQATALGLVAHPMAGFDEPAVRAAFSAPADLRILTPVAIGYPGPVSALPEDLQRREASAQERIPLDILVVTDHWTDDHGVSARELRKRTQG